MVDEILKWQDLDVRLSRTFSPATAINHRELFHGRQAMLRRLIDTANQAGQHAIIYGERGVGKTSLANVLSDFLRPLDDDMDVAVASAKVNCYRDTSYDEIWASLFDQADLTVLGRHGRLTPDDVFRTLRQDDSRKFILIVDEFDRIEDPDIDSTFADTVKTLSDFNVDATLVLVGVADDVDDLIDEHESIDRCLVQLHLPRMTFDELTRIIESGINSVGMEIDGDATANICTVSLGLPNYVHALGLASARAAIDDKRMRVETGDVETAIETVMSESQQTLLSQFDLATASPRRENLYFQVLLACALTQTDERGYFRAADLRGPYSHLMGRDMQISSYGRHLHGLSEERRGSVLQRLGQPHQYRFRFSNPLMQPYVLMRGIERGATTLPDIAALTAREP